METIELTALLQILTDPENQPHQYVGDQAALRKAIEAALAPTERMYETGLAYVIRRGTAWDVKGLYLAMLQEAAKPPAAPHPPFAGEG